MTVRSTVVPMRRDVFVYLSGPLTQNGERTREEHIAAAVKIYFELLRRGVPSFCPHLAGAFPSAYDLPYEQWIEYDYAMLDRCTHILMLDGWTHSKGAQLEREYAEQRGMRIAYTLAELFD